MFKKGNVAWNKGIARTPEEREKISKGHIGLKLSEDTRVKIALRMKGNNYARGLIHSDITKQKISVKLTGRKFSEEHKRKISLKLTGVKKSAEATRRNSESHKGKTLSEETKRRLSLSHTNPSEETRTKLSIGHRGLKRSEATITKMKIASKIRYERQRSEGNDLKGDKNPNYIDGRSYEPYTPSFYYKRKSIIIKYKFTCQNCGFNNPNIKQKKDTQYLTVHHIDYNKKNDADDNLIVLCSICNSKANANRDMWESKFRKQKSLECPASISYS